MKRTGRILALVLALAMLFSVTVFADWTVYGGNNNHNSVVTEAPTSTSPTVKEINLLNSGSGWDGVDNVPVMSTIGRRPMRLSCTTVMQQVLRLPVSTATM